MINILQRKIIGNPKETIGKPWENGGLPYGYIKITIENGHWNSESSHSKRWFSIVMLVYQRVYITRWVNMTWTIRFSIEATTNHDHIAMYAWSYVDVSSISLSLSLGVPVYRVSNSHADIFIKRPRVTIQQAYYSINVPRVTLSFLKIKETFQNMQNTSKTLLLGGLKPSEKY